jgi:hypothetical protein
MRQFLVFIDKLILLHNIEKIFYGFSFLLIIVLILNKVIKYDSLISTFVGGASAFLFSYLMEVYKEKNKKFDKVNNSMLALEICLRNVCITRLSLIDPEFIKKNIIFFPQLDIKNYFEDLLGVLERQDYISIMFIKKILIEIDSDIKGLEIVNNEILKKYILEEKIMSLSSSYQLFKETLRDKILGNTSALGVLIKILYPHIETYLKKNFPGKDLPVIEWEEIIEALGKV